MTRSSERFVRRAVLCSTALCLFILSLLTGCGGASGSSHHLPVLDSLVITPYASTIALGQTVQFRATGVFSDGSTRDETQAVSWKSGDSTVVSIGQAGLATSLSVGKAIVIAQMSKLSVSAMLTVSKATIVSISIGPSQLTLPQGSSAQLKVSAVDTDGNKVDVTNVVTWTTNQPQIAAISGAGVASGKAPGGAIVTASTGAVAASCHVTVVQPALTALSVQAAASAIPLGTGTQLKASGTYTDGSTRDVTNSVTWSSAPAGVLTMNGQGRVVGKTLGTASVKAAIENISGSLAMTVTAASLSSIAVQSGDSVIPLGEDRQLVAQGTYTDGSIRDLTNSVTWSSVPAGVVTFGRQGRATAKATGKASIKAESGSVSGSTSLTVTAATLVSIEVGSASAAIPLGAKRQLTALGTYSDGSYAILTNSVQWSSDPNSVIVIRSGGEALAMAMGTATVAATAVDVSGKALLTVGAATLASIVVTPASPTVPLESGLQLTSLGVFTDGTSRNLTPQSSWSVADPHIARITGSGKVTGQTVGSTVVTATSQGVSGSTTIVVQPIALVNYFSTDANGVETTIRLSNPGGTGSDLCTMIYVFNQNQQLAECCGCTVSMDGLRTLSLTNDLISNPLTGVPSTSGTVLLVTSDCNSSSPCNPASFSPSGLSTAWATHLSPGSNHAEVVSETEFSRTPLPPTLASSLQAQCMFIEQLGSGQGRCTCGTGD